MPVYAMVSNVDLVVLRYGNYVSVLMGGACTAEL